jgi:hypothetical protein
LVVGNRGVRRQCPHFLFHIPKGSGHQQPSRRIRKIDRLLGVCLTQQSPALTAHIAGSEKVSLPELMLETKVELD